MNDLQTYIYSGTQLRTIQQDDGLWWVLKDVCQVLGITDHKVVARRLEDDEVCLIPLIDSMGRAQRTAIINEPGLYNVILRSDKPEARAFKRWVTHEVLPSIRRTGSYATSEAMRRVSAEQAELNECRELCQYFEERTKAAARESAAARKQYDDFRAKRNRCREIVKWHEGIVDSAIARAAILE